MHPESDVQALGHNYGNQLLGKLGPRASQGLGSGGTSMSKLVTVTPQREAKKPTPSSLAPLRPTAAERCSSDHRSPPAGTICDRKSGLRLWTEMKGGQIVRGDVFHSGETEHNQEWCISWHVPF